jgi:hypothetical protein
VADDHVRLLLVELGVQDKAAALVAGIHGGFLLALRAEMCFRLSDGFVLDCFVKVVLVCRRRFTKDPRNHGKPANIEVVEVLVDVGGDGFEKLPRQAVP